MGSYSHNLDGLDNLSEYLSGTDPNNSDTDGGGENDGSEVLIHGLDPLDPADDQIEALAIDDPSVLGVVLSGSGPTIVAIARPGHEQEAVRVFEDLYRRLSLPAKIRVLSAHQPHAAAVATSRL